MGDFKTEDNDRVKAAEAASNALPDEDAEKSWKRKRTEEKEDPDERRKKRARAKHKMVKEQANADRARDTARARGAARRSRKAAQPNKMGAGADEKPDLHPNAMGA